MFDNTALSLRAINITRYKYIRSCYFKKKSANLAIKGGICRLARRYKYAVFMFGYGLNVFWLLTHFILFPLSQFAMSSKYASVDFEIFGNVQGR